MALSPLFSNNASDWTALPGLYISERNTPGAFVGRLRNSVGVCGECVRGPVNTAVSITDAAYFKSVFGERDQGGPVSDGSATITGLVWQALLNKKFGEVVVIRTAAAAAVAASKTLTSTGPVTNITVTAKNVGVWGNNMTAAVEAASNGVSTSRDIVIAYLGASYRIKNVAVDGSNDNTTAALAEVWPNPYQQLVTLTKGTAGTPDIAAAAALTSGAAGSIADSDFTATNGPMETLAAYAGLRAVWIAERTHSTTLQDKWETLAASAYDRLMLMGPSASSTTSTDAITNVASYRYKRIWYGFNHPLTTDPTTGLNITVRPESFMASYIAQTDVDVHPISGKASEAALFGVKALTNTAISRASHILLKNAGITAIDFDQMGIAHFASGVTTSLTAGEEEVVQRRMRDQLQLDLADLCAPFVGEKNSTSNRSLILSQIGDYLANKKANESIVSDYAAPAFISTTTEEAAGLAKILVRVKTFSHWIYLVIDTAIGPNVSIEESDTLPVGA